MKVSHTKIELYTTCPAKYFYKYVKRLDPDLTFTPLLFGKSVDLALNYVLTRTKHKHKVYIDTACLIFQKNMNQWNGSNNLVFFKNEMPEDIAHLYSTTPSMETQQRVWQHLVDVGINMLHTYVNEVLPMFAKILSVQTKREIPNEEGDTLVLVTDFTALLHDGRVVTFDNKTATDLKRNYGPKSVAKSQQLAIYTEFEESRLAGYIALCKKPVDGKIKWVSVIDTVPEEQVVAAFDKIDGALRAIKREEFPMNEKSCWAFGKICPYKLYCSTGNSTGLIKK